MKVGVLRGERGLGVRRKGDATKMTSYHVTFDGGGKRTKHSKKGGKFNFKKTRKHLGKERFCINKTELQTAKS